jgi:hypothetical protein
MLRHHVQETYNLSSGDQGAGASDLRADLLERYQPGQIPILTATGVKDAEL